MVATLTPEEVNEDRLEFARALSDEAGEDLASLGFQLDVLKIQNVSDATGYLEAIGREKAAEAIRDAEIAEADAEAATRERQAEAKQRAEITEAAAEIEIAEARNRLRVRQAELDREGETAEKVSRVKAMEAEVEAQRLLEAKRVEREQERLRADVVAPAEAEKEAAQARAEAEAAPLRERGRAQAEVLEMLYARIREGGAAGLPVFTLEKLPELLGISVEAIEGVDIDRLVVIDGGDGAGVASAANSRLRGALATLEGLSQALGLDLESLLRKVGGDGAELASGGDGVELGSVEATAPERVVSRKSD